MSGKVFLVDLYDLFYFIDPLVTSFKGRERKLRRQSYFREFINYYCESVSVSGHEDIITSIVKDVISDNEHVSEDEVEDAFILLLSELELRLPKFSEMKKLRVTPTVGVMGLVEFHCRDVSTTHEDAILALLDHLKGTGATKKTIEEVTKYYIESPWDK